MQWSRETVGTEWYIWRCFACWINWIMHICSEQNPLQVCLSPHYLPGLGWRQVMSAADGVRIGGLNFMPWLSYSGFRRWMESRSAISTFNVMGNHFYPIIIYEYCLWNGGWKLFQLWEMWEGFCLVFISAGDNNTKNFHNTIIFRWIFIFKLSPLINNIMSALLPNIRQRCMCAFCLLVYLHSKETLEFPNFVCYSTISLNFE